MMIRLRCAVVSAMLLACVSAAVPSESPVEPDQRRSVEQTFLTYPEWFLVHSPAEYASLVARKPAHDFPFLAHIGQLWSSYYAVIEEQARAAYPKNPGYHVMIVVISTSTTVEYAIRSAYENTIGQISWAGSSGVLTAEDRFSAEVAQDYVDFIRKEPWYLYNFAAKLKALWVSTPAFGPNMLRKWERRYALTTEYLIKAAYAKLIEKATNMSYEPALLTTQVVVDHLPQALPNKLGVELVKTLPDGRAILTLPRYYNFRLAATELAQSDVQLVDIAGNNTVILITAWHSTGAYSVPAGARVLFKQPLLTMPGLERVALVLRVRDLSSFLLRAPDGGWRVEHIYDY